MASSIGNTTAIHNARENRIPSFDQVSAMKAPLHFNTCFSSAKTGWNNNIWANASRASTFTDGTADAVPATDSTSHPTEGDEPFERKTGSGSLLSTSESEGWNGRSGLPWPGMVNNTSPVLSRANSHTISPLRQHEVAQNSLHISDSTGRSLPLSSLNRPSFGQMADQNPQNFQLESMLSLAPHATNIGSFNSLENSTSKTEAQQAISKTTTFGTHNLVSSAPSAKHYTSHIADSAMRNSTIFQPTSSSRTNSDLSTAAYFRPSVVPARTNFPHTTTPRTLHRPFHSTDASLDISLQDFDDNSSDRNRQLASDMDRLNLRRAGQPTANSRSTHRPTFSSQMSYEGTAERSSLRSVSDERFSFGQLPYVPDRPSEHGFQYPPAYDRSTSTVNRGSPTSSLSEFRRELNSTFFTSGSTPPVGPNLIRASSGSGLSSRGSSNQVNSLENKLRGLQPYQNEQQFLQANPLQMRSAFHTQNDMSYHSHIQMNPLATPYAMPPYSTYGNVPSAPSQNTRYGRAEAESSQIIRSAVLEDFRSNSKTNKRYDLKDIYNYVVEFSGDQYGSRFIQQKLETANSDEKEQIFSEIQPNSIQLMTDVFGNYVIQKLFEHGNQAQKKILANQMKGHILTLSTQMYGCRVVQKALEHVLVDQQASIVKELENNVIKCVKDQNGNHVIQKAIERVPAQYIQFIISAFHEQVQRLATHPYGCRVIQRLLEHCEESARRSILGELHCCVPTLIIDQYGNYVIQHVIENGEEKDRYQIVSVVISQLFLYSKHKFASNVVEKSIEFGEAGQKAEILRLLTASNDKGDSPALALVRDQYGNYVIQKVLGHLKGAEREALVDKIRTHLLHMKKFNYGKQVAAIEKLIYSPETDSNLSASSQSSNLPSTNASTVEGPTASNSILKRVDSEHSSTPTPSMNTSLEVN